MKTRTKKRTLAWVLTLALVFAMLPVMSVPALATGETRTLYFRTDGKLYDAATGGNEVNDVNNWTASQSTGSGNYDTLTLNGFTFNTTAATALQVPGGTTITLTDTNTITSTFSGDSATYGIYANGALIINGTGSFDVKSGDKTGTGSSKNSIGIYASGGTLTISSGIINAEGGNTSGGSMCDSVGIQGGGTIINGGTITAKAGTAGSGDSMSYGFSGNVTISTGDVTATGNTRAFAMSPTISAGSTYQYQTNATAVSPGSTWIAGATTEYPSASNADFLYVTFKVTVAPSGESRTLYFGNGNESWNLYTDSGLTTKYTENTSTWTAGTPNSTATLTLTNFNFSTTTKEALVFMGAARHVVLNGANTITSTSDDTDACGIKGDSTRITITGAGILNVNGVNAINTIGPITINSGTVNATANGASGIGVSTSGLTIAGGTVVASGGTSALSADYTVPNGYKYWKGANASALDGVGTTSIGNAGTDKIATTDKYAKVVVPVPYTVTYNAGTGGTGSVSDSNSPYTSGTKVTVLDEGNMTNGTKLFAGWKDGSGNTYYPNTTFTISADITLTAQWVEDKATKWRTTTLDLLTPSSPDLASPSNAAEGWAWNASTKTFTLKNAHIVGNDLGSGIYLPGGSTIVFMGENYVRGGDTSGDAAGSNGILAAGALTIKGAGTLHTTGGNTVGATAPSNGIYAGAVTISSGAVIATGGVANSTSCGIKSDNAINLNGGVVIARSDKADGKAMNKDKSGTNTLVTGAGGYNTNYAVYAPTGMFKTQNSGIGVGATGGSLENDGYNYNQTSNILTLKNLSIKHTLADAIGLTTGAEIVLHGINVVRSGDMTDVASAGIYVGDGTNGELTISGDGILIAIGGNSSNRNTCGIDAKTLAINSGKVTAIGGNSISSNSSFGILGATTISGVNTKVTAIGGAGWNSLGFNAPSITISGGNVTAVSSKTGGGNSFGLSSYPTPMIFGGGKGWAYGNKSINANITFNNGTGFLSGAAGEKAAVLGAVSPSNPPPPTSSGGGGGGGSTPPPSSTVIVDGKAVDAGEVKTSGDTTTVTVNQDTINKQLETASNNVTVNVPSDTGTAVATLVVQNVEDMAAKDMSLTVQVGKVAYEIPTTAMDTSAILAALGADNAADVPISISITTDMSAAAQSAVASALAAGTGELVIPPMEFKITATYNGQSVEIDTFSQYVARSVEITAEQAGKITTALVINPDGATRQVPTRVYQQNGKWYAEVNSLTNSTYAFISNEKTFADAKGKWYEKAVNEMGSRQIISGVGNDMFAGDNAITRAEFATIIIQALGLPTDGKGSVFSDVSATAWYSGVVGKAYEYNIVSGVGNNQFAPDKKITRQEAMIMIQRAAKVAGFTGSTGSLGTFSDNANVSDWALDAAQWNVGSGLIAGSGGKLNPTNNISRAETATLVLKLLQKSELVDVRTKF